MNIAAGVGPAAVAGSEVPHESAHLHVSGEALYVDDVSLPAGTLHAALGMSTIAHGHIKAMDLAAVRAAPGVVAIATAADVPGENNYGSVLKDDPIFTGDLVQYAGQPLFGVAATSYQAARRAAALARVEYDPLPALTDVRSALAAGSFVLPTQVLRRGDPHAALARAPRRLQGSITIGGQDHFYLEGQIAAALPQENGAMLVLSSTQHPSEVQHLVAHALDLRSHDVIVQCRRMGGGFGGKESQPALFACAAAVLAARTGRPVKLRADRDLDMLMTGKRHDFVADYEVGFDGEGRITALLLMLASRCGYSADLSGPVNDRALTHVDNAYFLEHVEIVSHRCKTHTVSNTAFRGFGGPQGMMAIEAVMDDIARHLGRDPLDVRRANFYGVAERNVTPYGMTVADNLLHVIADRLEASSGYRERRQEIERFNAAQHGREARHRDDAGEVRHFVQRRALQPGGRPAPRLHRRLGAAQPRRHRDGSGPLHQGRAGGCRGTGHPARARARLRRGHEQGPQYLRDRRLLGQRLERQGRAGRSADHQGAARRLRGRAAPRRARGGAVRGRPGRARRHGDGVCGAGARSLPRARPVERHGLLPHARHPLRPRDVQRPAVFLFRVRRGGVRSGGRHADGREPPAARGHPSRRRPVAQPGPGPRTGGGRISAGQRAG